MYFRQSAHGRPLEKQEGNWVTACGKNRPGENLAETGMSVVSSGNRQARDLRVQSRAGDSRTARAVAGEGSRVMPLERHEPHRMRGAANRLHTPPSRGAKSLPGPHLCCPRIKSSSVQSLSHVQLFATPWTAAHQASLSITNSI